jgi:Peptidase family M23
MPSELADRKKTAVGKANLVLALSTLLLFAGAYWINLLPESFTLLCLTLLVATVASRIWRARRGQLEYGLVRSPLQRTLRPHVLQCLNHWLFWGLFGLAIVAGTFTVVPAQIGSLFALPLPHRIPSYPLLIMLGVGALVLAALELVPVRRVPIATNVLVLIGSVFLAVQPVRVYLPPTDVVVLDPPLAGEWDAVAAGRSVLVSHHYSTQTPQVADAVDFVRIVDQRGYDGNPDRADSWYGFGEPVLAPADGTVVSASDSLPDEPIGATGVTPPHGNHIVLEIGKDRYAVLAHLEQGSALVIVGERVRSGQPLGAVGDSGNSLWPHLHFHVQTSPALDAEARTVPVMFRDAVLDRYGRSPVPGPADLRRGDRIRPIAN